MKKSYLLLSYCFGLLLAALVLGIVNLQVSAAVSEDPVQSTVSNAIDYLKTQQEPSTGGYGTGASTADSTLAIGSANYKAREWRNGAEGLSLMDYWLSNARGYSRVSAGEAGKLAMGLVAADGCLPSDALKPGNYYDPGTGMYHPDNINQAFAILGTAAMNQPVPAKAVDHLKGKIEPDGGWKYGDLPFFTTDTNTTAAALMALIAAGESPSTTEVISGLNFIKSSQSKDGGFFYSDVYTTTSDTNSTAYAVQAIIAAGDDPGSGNWVVDSTNPISYLLDMQLPDGSFEWMKGAGSNILATQQAIPALLEKPFPIAAADLLPCPILIPYVSR
jgi:iron complex transport system substrate-binding protein